MRQQHEAARAGAGELRGRQWHLPVRDGPRELRPQLPVHRLTGIIVGSSLFVRLLPQLEQQVLANAYNFSLINWTADNGTVGSTGLSVLWCPSDGSIAGLRSTFAGWGWDGSTQTLVYTSYAGNMGTFTKVPITVTSLAQHMAVLNQANGVFFYLGWPAWNPAGPARPNRPAESGQHPPGHPGLGHGRPEQHVRLRREGARQVQPDPRHLLFHRLPVQRRLGVGRLRRHAIHGALSDEPIRPDRRRPQRRLFLQLRRPGGQLLDRRVELPSRRLQFRISSTVRSASSRRRSTPGPTTRPTGRRRTSRITRRPASSRPARPRACTRRCRPAPAARSSAAISIEMCVGRARAQFGSNGLFTLAGIRSSLNDLILLKAGRLNPAKKAPECDSSSHSWGFSLRLDLRWPENTRGPVASAIRRRPHLARSCDDRTAREPRRRRLEEVRLGATIRHDRRQ